MKRLLEGRGSGPTVPAHIPPHHVPEPLVAPPKPEPAAPALHSPTPEAVNGTHTTPASTPPVPSNPVPDSVHQFGVLAQVLNELEALRAHVRGQDAVIVDLRRDQAEQRQGFVAFLAAEVVAKIQHAPVMIQADVIVEVTRQLSARLATPPV